MNRAASKVPGPRRLGALILCVALVGVMSGHVGSKNVFFQGQAGPYPVSVVIRPPDVVPGLAEVSVRVAADDVDRVTVQPFRWDATPGSGAPPPDEASPVPGDDALFAAELWLMTTGTYRVDVAIEGDRGQGTVTVPVTSVARNILDMSPGLAAVLLGLTAFLLIGAVSIFGAAVRESSLEASSVVAASNIRRGRVAMAMSAVAMIGLVYSGKAWWDAVDRGARSGIFQPLQVEASVVDRAGTPALEIAITDPAWLGRGWSPIMPDHGKLMHMFVVGTPEMTAFAHVHPVPVDSSTFRVPWPELPAGTYRIYGDLVHESGFAQTVVDTIVVEAAALMERPEGADVGEALVADADDSAWTGAPTRLTGSETRTTALADGSTLVWRGDAAPSVDEEIVLSFEVHDPDGGAARLEPYMGMLSHAAVTRDDGAVFVHLHPSGTISMGSLSILERRAAGDPSLGVRTVGDSAHVFMLPETDREGGTPMQMPQTESPGVVSFPFAFPQPGEYTIWVQVKREGRVLTGAFQTEVLQ